jgi:hypothetical protein
LHAPERERLGSLRDLARRKDLVHAAERGDETARLAHREAALAQRIAVRLAEELLVRRGERRHRRADGKRCGEDRVRVHR